MKLKQLFEKVAAMAGIATTDAKYVAALELIPADVDVDDDVVANPITKNLITLAEAEASPALKGKFVAEAYNGVDALINPVLADFLEPAEIDALKGDKMTTKKLNKLLEKAKAAKAATGNSAETAKAIADLNAEVAKLKTDKDTEIGTLKQQYATERYFDRLAMKVTSRNDVTEQAKAKDAKRVMLDFQDTLDAVGGVLDIATGKVMQKADPTMPLFVNNKAVTAETVLEQTLKDNDWLKKSNGPAPTTTVITEGGGGSGTGRQPTHAQMVNAAALKGA